MSGFGRLEFPVQLKRHRSHGRSLGKKEDRDFKNILMVVISTLLCSRNFFGRKKDNELPDQLLAFKVPRIHCFAIIIIM